MNTIWVVDSVNGQKTGQEGFWTSLDQIQGHQTLLRDSIFGIYFRIIPRGFEKFSDIYIKPDIYNMEEAKQNNNAIQYVISGFGFDPLNPYYKLFNDSGINMHAIYKQLEEKLTDGSWYWYNVQGLMDYGVIEEIRTKLQHEDKKNNKETENLFLSQSALKIMNAIEWTELSLKGTDEERLDVLENELNIESKFDDDEKSEDDIAWEFVYKKYKKIVNEKEKIKNSGAKSILEYMKNHGLTIQDLLLALTMAQATKTGVKEAESHIISEKTIQQQKNEEEIRN